MNEKCEMQSSQAAAYCKCWTMQGCETVRLGDCEDAGAGDKQCDRIFNDQCQMKSEKRWNGNKLKREQKAKA